MKVIKVIVDELPKNCCTCFLVGDDSSFGYCLAGEELESDYFIRRPDWCPLVDVRRLDCVYQWDEHDIHSLDDVLPYWLGKGEQP